MTIRMHRAFALIAILLLPQLAHAQDVTGLWRTPANEQGYLEIDLRNCGSAICGTIARARDLQGQVGPYEHVGKRMIWDMMPTDSADVWKGGKIWDPRNGRTFNSRMTLAGNELSVAGCVLGICQSQTWTRLR